MKSTKWHWLLIFILHLSSFILISCGDDGNKGPDYLYPGMQSSPTDQASAEIFTTGPNKIGTKGTAYRTGDSFDQIQTFYNKGISGYDIKTYRPSAALGTQLGVNLVKGDSGILIIFTKASPTTTSATPDPKSTVAVVIEGVNKAKLDELAKAN